MAYNKAFIAYFKLFYFFFILAIAIRKRMYIYKLVIYFYKFLSTYKNFEPHTVLPLRIEVLWASKSLRCVESPLKL